MIIILELPARCRCLSNIRKSCGIKTFLSFIRIPSFSCCCCCCCQPVVIVKALDSACVQIRKAEISLSLYFSHLYSTNLELVNKKKKLLSFLYSFVILALTMFSFLFVISEYTYIFFSFVWWKMISHNIIE